jgi:Flp pilus assembly protein TadD
LEDFAGGEDGSFTRSGEEERPEGERIFLPMGHKSRLDRVGGAEDVGPVHTRGEDQPGLGALDLEETLEVQKTAGMEEVDWMEADDGIELPPMDEVEREVVDTQSASTPTSTREGWGFTDWYAGTTAQAEAGEIRERIHFAKRLLAIDPDSDWALQTLAYYQYLAQDYQATIATYERFIDLYPDDPTGYNNVALVYKRTGEYSVEEGYYRRALAIESVDVHALNNLAVNLAHQHRFQEALSIMERLERLDPEDPYADLHRAKIYAEMGRERRAYRYLKRALEGMAALDTLHHIEFRQDIRIDPSFSKMRKERRFQGILERYYGEDGARGLAGDFRG